MTQRPGAGALEVARVGRGSAAVGVRAAAPLRLLVPRPRGPAVWAWASSFGGGLVSGDRLDLSVTVGAGARCFLGTQASTKVYRAAQAGGSVQHTRADVAAGGLLALLPEHLTAFRGARLAQTTEVYLAGDASAVVLDWYSAGREAHRPDEVWAAASLSTQVQIRRDGTCVLHDGTLLEDAPGLPTVRQRMGHTRVVASLVAVGPLTATLRAWVEAHAARAPGKQPDQVESLAPLGTDGLLWRLAGDAVEPVAARLRAATATLAPLLGGDPGRAQVGARVSGGG